MLVVMVPHVCKILTSLTISLSTIYSMALSAFSLRNAYNVKTISTKRIGKELADLSVEVLMKIPKHHSRDSRCP
jgi:hypothetical protein